MRKRTLYALLAFAFVPAGIWWRPEAFWGVLILGYLSRRAEKIEHMKDLEQSLAEDE